MARRRSARFAVGTFSTWDGACEALRDLRVAGVDAKTLSFLGLHRTMAGATKHSLELQLRELALTKAGEPVCCTAGLLADRLAERVNDGAATLQEALGLWLVSRHAELSPEVGDGGNRKGGISWGCLTTSLLHRRSDMPCRTITLSA